MRPPAGIGCRGDIRAGTGGKQMVVAMNDSSSAG